MATVKGFLPRIQRIFTDCLKGLTDDGLVLEDVSVDPGMGQSPYRGSVMTPSQ